MKICSICGSSYSQIVERQMAGCPECYYTFEEEFREFFEAKEMPGTYSGSLPKNLKGYKSKLAGRVETQLKLEEAIKNEEYEKAALYRDYLKVLNNPKIMSGEDSYRPENNNTTADSDSKKKGGER